MREAGIFPGDLECTPLGASMLGGHDECTKILADRWGQTASDASNGAGERTIGSAVDSCIASWVAPCVWHSSLSQDGNGLRRGVRTGSHGVVSIIDLLRWRHDSRTAGTIEGLFRPIAIRTSSHVTKQLQDAHDAVRTHREGLLGMDSRDRMDYRRRQLQ